MHLPLGPPLRATAWQRGQSQGASEPRLLPRRLSLSVYWKETRAAPRQTRVAPQQARAAPRPGRAAEAWRAAGVSDFTRE
jgi:hypothetical protein